MKPKKHSPLAAAFFGAFHRSAPVPRGNDQANLERRLEAAFAKGVEAWPGIDLPATDFAAFLGGFVPTDSEPCAWLSSARVSDLFLACGCTKGLPAAIEAFWRQLNPVIESAISRLSPDFDQVEDVQQAVFQKVFIPERDRPARISQYSGRGDFKAWIRVVAVRLAQNMMRKHYREKTSDDSLIAHLVQRVGKEGNRELGMIKQLYRQDFTRSFRLAIADLDPDERNILRYRFVDRLTLDQIALLYQVHRMTISRRLEKIESFVLERTRERLQHRLGGRPDEIESMIRLLESQIAAGISSVLGPAPAFPDEENRDCAKNGARQR